VAILSHENARAKSHVFRPGGRSPRSEPESTVEQVELEIEIAASPRRVWKPLTEETPFWWPRDFYTKPKAKGFHIEAKLGGKMYEDCGGDGLIVPRLRDRRGALARPSKVAWARRF
jgi:hypothetical protein